MRIDLGQATAAAVQAEVNSDATRAIQARQRAEVETSSRSARLPDPAPSPEPQPQLLRVSIDQNRNTIYRFLDEKTGELVRQVPPEEVLRIMRNIEQMLQAAEQKLKITL